MTAGMVFDVEGLDSVEEVAELLEEVGDRIVNESRVSATNKTMTQSRTQMRRDISKETGVPSKALSKRFKLHRAKRSNRRAAIFIGTYPFAVYDLGFRKMRRGVSFRGGGARVKNQSAFVADMPSGKTSLWVRKGKARLPIKKVTISIIDATRRSADRIRRTFFPATFKRVFNQEFGFRTKRAIDRRRLNEGDRRPGRQSGRRRRV